MVFELPDENSVPTPTSLLIRSSDDTVFPSLLGSELDAGIEHPAFGVHVVILGQLLALVIFQTQERVELFALHLDNVVVIGFEFNDVSLFFSFVGQ